MPAKIALSVTLTTALLSGCATNKTPEPAPIEDQTVAALDVEGVNAEGLGAETADGESNAVEIEGDIPHSELVENLPNNIESFEIESARAFDAEGEGVTVRYANARKHRSADVFVYPVSEENKSLKHPDLVMGSTQATMQAISEAVQQGVYHNLDVIDAATKAYGLRTVARVQATYLRQNLASYTLVYQTEHDGTMVKIRMNMPDNVANRVSREWDRFVDVVLDSLTEKLDEQNAAEPSIASTASL